MLEVTHYISLYIVYMFIRLLQILEIKEEILLFICGKKHDILYELKSMSSHFRVLI